MLIEIPAEHPAARGKAITLTATSQEQADALRALVNGTYYRNKDVQDRDAKILQLSEQIARFEAGQSAVEKWRGTPEYKAAVDRYHQIKETIGQEAASEYWQGVERKLQDIVETEFKDRWGEVEVQANQQAADDWRAEAYRRAQGWVPADVRRLPGYEQMFESVYQAFDAQIGALAAADPQGLSRKIAGFPLRDLDGNPENMQKAFVAFFQSQLLADPDVRAALSAARARGEVDARAAAERAAQAKREREQIEQAAIERYKREAAQVRTETPPNPLAPLGGVTRAPVPAAPTPEPLPASASPQQIRRAAKQGAKQDAQRYFRTP